MSVVHGGGGAATQAGISYQNRVAAWIAASILAEAEASPPWKLPVNVTLKFLRCETEQPVDDILVGTSDNGHAFIQVKHRLTLATAAKSDLGSTIDQFVRQFFAYSTGAKGKRPWERPLDAERDRLVLITSPASSSPIREHLPAVLDKLRLAASDQTLDDNLVSNQGERDALNTLRNHVTYAWQTVAGKELTDNEFRQISHLIYIQVLDVDEGGNDEDWAKDRLRYSVLSDPTQADSAWNTLIKICGQFAINRSGGDSAILQTVLSREGISLKPARSYQNDIERLQQYSRSTAQMLSEFSKIRVGNTEVKIPRPVINSLQAAANKGSLLVVGEPGAGKSGVLYEFAQSFLDREQDVVFIAVDQLDATSSGTLRNEIGLEHDLVEVLNNWVSQQPGWVVIDALDAARSGDAFKMFRDLIAQIRNTSGRWRVVASIRKFDLRYNTELQRLFRGTLPIEFQDKEFVKENVCHLNVPQLSDDELAQIREQSEHLADFIDNARHELRDLLKVPFNLRLMGDVIGKGVTNERFTPIVTQIELLEWYWQERVIDSCDQAVFSDAREMVLRQAVKKMVEKRSLRVNRSEVLGDSASSLSLNQVLKDHVLVEWQASSTARPDRYMLTFSHHILFDYAVARLILRLGQQTPVEQLEKDKELVLAIRPSLVFHFRYLWSFEEDRNSFWKLLFQVLSSPTIPEIGKLIGASVAAESITQISDYEPLLRKLEDTDPKSNEIADQAFNHLVGALLAAPTTNRPLTGDGAPPWCQLLERCTRLIRLPVARTVCLLLVSICEHPEQLTIDQRNDAGITARKLLEFFWTQEPRNQWLVTRALEAVCRTFESDPKASATLLRKCLEKEHLEIFGFQEMYWLAEEVGRLIPLDAELIGEIYRAVFTYQENREIQTSILSSRILPLTSTASQDYQMARYQLVEIYPEFLQNAPVQATSVLVEVIAAYVEEEHCPSEWIEEQFDFNGQKAIIRTDNSEIWDSATYRSDNTLKMLDVFDKYLQNLSQEPQRKRERQELIDIIVLENRLAIIWRHLLICGTKIPNTLGHEIRYLAWAMPILTSYDTTIVVGNFIAAIFKTLRSNERECIERAILSIPDLAGDKLCETAEHIRNRLLGCLPQNVTLAEETKQVLQELSKQGNIPPNEPSISVEVSFFHLGEKEFLANQGVPVDDESNRRIQELEVPIKRFTETYQNSTPKAEEINAIIPNLRSLKEALVTADEEGVHLKQRDYAWGYLAKACEQIGKLKMLSCEDEAGSFAKQVLLQASEYPDPLHRPEFDEQFDDYPSWGSPAARIDAAQGLLQLTCHPSCLDENLLKAVERLSCDNVPAVRYQIATYLLSLYQTEPNLMWNIIDRMSREDQSYGVLQGLLEYSLSRLADSHADRVADITKIIFDRITDGKGSSKVRAFCTFIFTGLHLWQNHCLSTKIVYEIASNPERVSGEASKIVVDLRDYLTIGSIESPNPAEDEVRRRAFALMDRILESAHKAYDELEAKYRDFQSGAWSDEDQEKVKKLVLLVDSVANQLYFASGAFDDIRGEERRSAAALGNKGKKRFLEEVGSILDKLADLAFPSIAHHLIETLVFLVDVEPEEVFLRIGRIVQTSQSGGYQYESLAADLIVRFIERFLAEYRYILRKNEECRNVLIEILDTFVQAGWSSARGLTYRMEEIFR